MNEYLATVVESTRRNGVLVDTNLLLLLFVGGYDPSWIPKFKRTYKFEEDDYALLNAILKPFDRILTTPHILTEVSNLSNQLPNNIKDEYFTWFRNNLEYLEEHYTESVAITKQPAFSKYGLTDAAIILLAQRRCLVLTVDFPLSNFLQGRGHSVINFNHIRSSLWFDS